MKCALLALAALAATSSIAHAQNTYTLYATDVPDRGGWSDEQRARGNPQNLDCNNSSYASSTSTTVNWLAARSFNALLLPQDELITKVSVDVLCRFDVGERGSVRLRVSDGIGGPITSEVSCFDSGSQANCRWRFNGGGNPFGWDITSFFDWNSDPSKIQDLDLLVRRRTEDANCLSNTPLRVKAFRIVVETAPCGTSLECQATPNSAGSGTNLEVIGFPSLSSGALSLRVTGAPLNSSGFTWIGDPIAAPVASGNGLRCFGNGRRIPPIWNAGTSGSVSYVLDFGNPALAGVMVGDTIILQCVHRDSIGAGFDFSDARRVVVCP